MAKKVYGIHFAGVWVNQATRVIESDLNDPDGIYSPARMTGDNVLVPAEYAVASSPSVAIKMFFKYFDFARKKYDPMSQLVLLCQPMVIEYDVPTILANPKLRDAVAQCCMAYYYGWDEESVAVELANAVNGAPRYEDLF